MSSIAANRVYTFAGNDDQGLMMTIEVSSSSPAAADKAAKKRLKNARMIRVSWKSTAGKEGM